MCEYNLLIGLKIHNQIGLNQVQKKIADSIAKYGIDQVTNKVKALPLVFFYDGKCWIYIEYKWCIWLLVNKKRNDVLGIRSDDVYC